MNHLPGMQKALDLVGTHSIGDLEDAVRRGDARAFVNDTSVLIVQVNEYPKCRALEYWVASGDLDGVLDLLPEIEEWALDMGCTVAHMGGRRGWKPVLEKLGWDTRFVAMRKELKR